ncbi:MAG: anthranilate synthase component I, partial [Oscillospiraceae bacterium]|nr:anthranilate synthase component I [Oscillospiraceae bacterium]
MVFPSLEQLRQAAAGGAYKTAPVGMEILSDVKTPIEVLRILKNISEHCYMLESVEGGETWGRYTFLGYEPKLELTCLNGVMKVGGMQFETDDPGKYIKQIL